ncbi:MAG: YihY/virulence factor BrkB family protein [Armatimonadetes bacterium]|nr:YihY/virulence factor BrkB family protein [Armatimonadota bacterium]
MIASILTRLRRIFWINFLFVVFERFGRDNGGLLAAGLAFFLVLAFVPLLLVGLWFLGHLYAGRPDEALYQIKTNILPQIIPNGGASKEMTRLMMQAGIAAADGQHAGPALLRILRGGGLAGTLSLLTTVWAAIQIFINGSAAMNAAWEAQEKRNWVVLRLVALGLLVATGILLVASLFATGFSTKFSDSRFAHLFPLEGALTAGLVEAGAIAVSALMYAITYKFLPSAHVSWKAAFAGGAFAAVTWEIAKKLLAVWLLRPNHSLYGDLGNLIVFILWVLYSMTILLLGAEVSAVYANTIEGGPRARLKRAAQATPAADVAASSSSPLARAKERDRARRIRKTGQKEGQQAGRQ